MPIISIIRPSDGETFSFDAVELYTQTNSADVTEHPVERGTPSADHARVNPKLLGFAGVVTETPFDNRDSTGGPDRVQRALDFLDSLGGTYATVVWEFGSRTMSITRWSNRRGRLRKVDVDVEFKEVRIAEAGLITISPSAPAAGTTAAANTPDAQDVGEQGTTDATKDVARTEQDRSLLLDLLDSVGEAP